MPRLETEELCGGDWGPKIRTSVSRLPVNFLPTAQESTAECGTLKRPTAVPGPPAEEVTGGPQLATPSRVKSDEPLMPHSAAPSALPWLRLREGKVWGAVRKGGCEERDF